MSINNMEGSLFHKPAHTDPKKAVLDQRSSKHFRSIFSPTFSDTPGDRVILHMECNLHRSMCHATTQQMELEICVHDTTLHPSEEEEEEQHENRSSRHLLTECHTRVSVCHTGRGNKTESVVPSALHVALRVTGWFQFVCFVSSTSSHVRLEAAGDLPVHPFIYSSFYLNPLSPSVFHLIKSHFSPLLATQFIPDNPFYLLHLPCHRPPSLACLCASSLWPSVSPSSSLRGWQCGELRNRVHVTVWHVSEPDVVNMLPADSAVELNTLHFGPASLHHPVVGVCVAGSKSLLLHGCFKQFFSPWRSKVSRISCLLLFYLLHISSCCSGVCVNLAVKAEELHRMI